MKAYLLALLAAVPVQAFAAATPPRCSSMLMPAADLKRVSSRFGPRSGEFHPGIDLSAPYGSGVRAAQAGTVVYAGWYGEYGKMVEVRGREGVVTRYAHLSVINRSARLGRRVIAGEAIGAVGATGLADGPHLHFEVRVGGRPADPARYLTAAACGGPSGGKVVQLAQAAVSPPSGGTAPHIRPSHHAHR